MSLDLKLRSFDPSDVRGERARNSKVVEKETVAQGDLFIEGPVTVDVEQRLEIRTSPRPRLGPVRNQSGEMRWRIGLRLVLSTRGQGRGREPS